MIHTSNIVKYICVILRWLPIIIIIIIFTHKENMNDLDFSVLDFILFKGGGIKMG